MSDQADTPNCVRAVILNGSQLLVTRPNERCREFDQSMLFLPGGHIQRGETARSAIIRELTEELGLEWEATPSLLLGIGDIHWYDDHQHLQDEIDLVFLIDPPEDMNLGQPLSRDPYIDYIWVDIDEAVKQLS